MNVHELREAFMARSLGTARTGALAVTFLSFGFKYGLPLDADLVFDVRFLPNPHFVARLRERTGRDRPIVQFLDRFEDTGMFLSQGHRPAAVPDSALRPRGQELPDRRHRLHRRPASLGRHVRGAGQGAEGPHRRAPARQPPGRRQCLIPPSRSQPSDPPTVVDVPRAPLIGVVVVTHGQLATELVNAAEMIVGELSGFVAVSIGWHDDVETAREAIAAAIGAWRGRPASSC